jgi:hypothetical protein
MMLFHISTSYLVSPYKLENLNQQWSDMTLFDNYMSFANHTPPREFYFGIVHANKSTSRRLTQGWKLKQWT